MGKFNWGTTAEVLTGVGAKVADKVKQNKAKKQETQYNSSGSGVDPSLTASPSSFKRGGKVKKTGFAKVHKGEKVLTKAQQKKSCGKR